MAEKNVVIRITSESDLSKSSADLETLKEKEKELLAAMDALKKKQLEFQGAEKVTQALRVEYDKLDQELKKTKSDLDVFAKAATNVNNTVATGAVSSKRLTTQLREMKNELAKLEDSGVSPTDKSFISLAVKAAKLEDQIGDTRQRISALASDTKNLDAAMSVGQGLAGGFTAATSAAALFGGENEELTKAFLKAQAALSILNGVQMVANTLNKDSIASVVIGTALENSNTVSKVKNAVATGAQTAVTFLQTKAEQGNVVAKVASTIAQNALNSAMLANPVTWLLGGIAALVIVLSNFVGKSDDAAGSSKKYASALDGMRFATEEARDKHNDFIKKIRDTQVEIDLARGKISQYQAELQKLNNTKLDAGADAVQQYTKETSEAFDKLKKDYGDGFFSSLWAGAKNVFTGGGSVESANKEYQKAVTDARRKANQTLDQADAQAQKDKELLDAKNAKESAKSASAARIAAMQEGYAKERATILNNYKNQLADTGDSTSEEKNLRSALTAQMNRELSELNKKYHADSVNDNAEYRTLLAQNSLAQNKTDYDLQKKALEASANQQEASIKTATARTAAEKAVQSEKIKAIQLKLADDLKAIDYKMLNDEIELTIQQGKNYVEQLKLSSIEESKVKDDANKALLQDQADAEIASINQTVMSEDQRAEKIKSVRLKLQADLKSVDDSAKRREIDAVFSAAEKQIETEKYANEKILADSKSSGSEKLNAKTEIIRQEELLDQAKLDKLNSEYESGLVNEKTYQDGIFEIKKSGWDRELKALEEKAQREKEIQQTTFNMVSELGSALFSAKSSQLSAELEQIENTYTTDAEAAKENSNLKLISEKELASKKLEIKRKQAIADKQQAMFNIALSTAQGVMAALASIPPNVPLSILIGATGAIQLAAVAAKPLPKYAKGKKAGGQGHFATVGELGSETVWLPDGAAVIPHHRQLDYGTFRDFNIPVMPDVRTDMTGWSNDIDYDRLGKAVADNVKIPSQKYVSVHVDSRGVTISDGIQKTTYLNKKYGGSWN